MPTEAFRTIHHAKGVPWDQAPIPNRWHMCKVQTWGFISNTLFSRCPCGGIRRGLAGYWVDRNTRREK